MLSALTGHEAWNPEAPTSLSHEGREMILFFQPDGPSGFLSQFYPSPFTDAEIGTTFSCAEQYMMACKAQLMNDSKSFDKILVTSSPRELKRLGSRVFRFDSKLWDSAKGDIVHRANLLKFNSTPLLTQALLETGDAYLAEASPTDRVWGIGLDAASARLGMPWKGENLLGKILMTVRASLT